MEVMDSLRAALKELILPELDRIKQENAEINAKLELTNKRLDDINLHLADQSRRIDETNRRMDALREELGTEIRETNQPPTLYGGSGFSRAYDVKRNFSGNQNHAPKRGDVLSGRKHYPTQLPRRIRKDVHPLITIVPMNV